MSHQSTSTTDARVVTAYNEGRYWQGLQPASDQSATLYLADLNLDPALASTVGTIETQIADAYLKGLRGDRLR